MELCFSEEFHNYWNFMYRTMHACKRIIFCRWNTIRCSTKEYCFYRHYTFGAYTVLMILRSTRNFHEENLKFMETFANIFLNSHSERSSRKFRCISYHCADKIE